jgi:lipopolysaccharide export system permease protein
VFEGRMPAFCCENSSLMLFHSSLRKELARSFGATLIVLATVVMTMTLIRTLGAASRGSLNPSDVMLIMGYTVLAQMPTVLTLSLFISIIATLSRMYRDSEMVIWFSSGRGLASLIAPLFRFAWPLWAVVMALALFVLPWSNRQIEVLRAQYEQRGDIERIEPGQFQESASGNRVFFVEKDVSSKQSGSNVFIATNEQGRETITSARSGRIQNDGQDRFLMLNNGQRLERQSNGQALKLSEFEQYGFKVGANDLVGKDEIPVTNRLTIDLLRDLTPKNLAELSWRFGLILAAFNFVVIGIAVSSVNPRVGRSANLVFALFSFVLYFNLLNLGQSWIASGQWTFSAYFTALHGGVLLLGAFWLARSHNNWRLKNLWAWRPARNHGRTP